MYKVGKLKYEEEETLLNILVEYFYRILNWLIISNKLESFDSSVKLDLLRWLWNWWNSNLSLEVIVLENGVKEQSCIGYAPALYSPSQLTAWKSLIRNALSQSVSHSIKNAFFILLCSALPFYFQYFDYKSLLSFDGRNLYFYDFFNFLCQCLSPTFFFWRNLRTWHRFFYKCSLLMFIITNFASKVH